MQALTARRLSPSSAERSTRARVGFVLLCVAVGFGGCQCNIDDTGLDPKNDAGFSPNDAGPPPPVFPLKVDDQLEYRALGGRTATCAGSATPGDCQRSMSANYVIKSVVLNDANRWEVTADFIYQGTSDLVSGAEIAPLILENGAPFSSIASGEAQDGTATFQTNTAPTDELTANGFPFFQYESDNAGEGTVFQEAGNAFCARLRTLDPDAECSIQAADQKFSAYYVDNQAGAGAMLHKVRTEFQNFGFYCGWDEALVPYTDGMARSEGSFGAGTTPTVAAIFFPPRLTRGAATYTCQCSTQQCRNQADNTCLDPTDPDAEPTACN